MYAFYIVISVGKKYIYKSSTSYKNDECIVSLEKLKKRVW